MNNDLEQFSEERLKDMQKHVTAGITLGHADALLIRQALDIALAAKREFKINATLRDINLNVSREAYSASLELNNFLKDNRHVHQIMNSVGDSQLWVDCSEDAYKCEIDEGGVGRILYTTPQPAHTEQSEMLNKARSLSESIGELRKQIDSSGGYDFEALRSEQVNSPVIPDGWRLVPIEPTQEMVDAHISGMQSAGFSRAYRDMLAAAPKPESE